MESAKYTHSAVVSFENHTQLPYSRLELSGRAKTSLFDGKKSKPKIIFTVISRENNENPAEIGNHATMRCLSSQFCRIDQSNAANISKCS